MNWLRRLLHLPEPAPAVPPIVQAGREAAEAFNDARTDARKVTDAYWTARKREDALADEYRAAEEIVQNKAPGRRR